MNKKLSAVILSGVAVLVAIGAFMVLSNKSDKVNNSVATTTDSDAVMEKQDTVTDEAMTTDEVMTKSDDQKTMEKTSESSPTNDEAAVMKNPDSYVTLTSFNADPGAYSDVKKVYFFHAPWCPICQGIDKEISADQSRIPTGTTFIKTDYDSNTSLRQKFGVTYQYTFVQVDNDGNLIKKWSATNLDKAVAGIQ